MEQREVFTITDLISTEMLQKLQDSFAALTGMAALITDTSGRPLTEGSNFSRVCMEHIRSNGEGCKRCEQCDRNGAQEALQTGRSVTYVCHAGLIDFAAPIMAEGRMIGAFIGGQVVEQIPQEEKVREIAKELDIDPEILNQAMQEVAVCSHAQIAQAVKSLDILAEAISELAVGRYKALEANEEIARTAQLRSDFLANMSHKIRTPMNAVIGMAEMALREDMTDQARTYINQIKSAGRSLLNVINDILDFSKIDSGKMEIVKTEYEPLSMFHDVETIISTRLKDKPVQLLLKIEPSYPGRVFGDHLRIRQVLLNLCNNAVKFTNRGRVQIFVDYEKLDADTILTKIAIKDTGIGIKKEDMDKLFQSFQQLDSKRNRTVEGTGLGLAISKRLVELMGGSIHVESVYEKGSVFSIEFPQKVIDWSPVIQVTNATRVAALGYWENRYLARQFYGDTKKLGVFSAAVLVPEQLEDLLHMYREQLREKKIYLFFQKKSDREDLQEILQRHPEITGVELIGFFDQEEPKLPNVHIFREPMSTTGIAMALNDETGAMPTEDSGAFTFLFRAPEANVLIVDDNAINLTVTEGLLEPLKMKITSALSGREALELIDKNRYDLIFMDHMMPELDGVETTRIIRRLHPEYADVPIIALTANAVDGAKDMFLSEGMNDFVPKPIEVQLIVRKVREWLPPEKIQKTEEVLKEQETQLSIGDLDTAQACRMLGGEALFKRILQTYYKNIPSKYETIQRCIGEKDWKTYTIEVHALKSSSRQIGAMQLGAMAEAMEEAAKAGNFSSVCENTHAMLEKYQSYVEVLRPFCQEERQAVPKQTFDQTKLLAYFDQLQDAIEDLDMDAMELVIKKLETFDCPKAYESCMQELKAAVDAVDGEKCEQVMEQFREKLKKQGEAGDE